MQRTSIVIHKNYPRKIQSYVFLTVLLLAAALVYGYFQFQKLTESRNALALQQSQLTQLQTAEKQISQDYVTIKDIYNETYKDVRESVNAVLPTEESYTELTKQLDAFMYEHNTERNPIFMSDLKFSKERIEADKDYAILPFSLSLSTTRQNFEEFLKYAANSGSLEEGTRLIEITSISISFPNQPQGPTALVKSADAQLINVSVSLQAYFQKSVILTNGES